VAGKVVGVRGRGLGVLDEECGPMAAPVLTRRELGAQRPAEAAQLAARCRLANSPFDAA
jgi:hypothetical protein